MRNFGEAGIRFRVSGIRIAADVLLENSAGLASTEPGHSELSVDFPPPAFQGFGHFLDLVLEGFGSVQQFGEVLGIFGLHLFNSAAQVGSSFKKLLDGAFRLPDFVDLAFGHEVTQIFILYLAHKNKPTPFINAEVWAEVARKALMMSTRKQEEKTGGMSPRPR